MCTTARWPNSSIALFLPPCFLVLTLTLLLFHARLDWTDVHYRQMARLLSKKTWLWTEMIVDKTIMHTQQIERCA